MAIISQVIAFAISLGSGVTSNTATIATVDTTLSAIMWGGSTYNGGNVDSKTYLGRAVLTNATTVTATRGAGTNTLVVYGTVVEFDASVITSLEQNTVTIAAGTTSGTTTLGTTIADTSKAVLFYHGNETAGTLTTNAASTSQCALDLTNSTTVTAVRDTSDANRSVTASFTVIEFDSSFISSVEKRSVTLTSANTSDTDTITSVDTSRSFLVWNGFTSNNNTSSNAYYNITLTGATQVTLARSGTATGTRTIKYTVVQLQSGILDSVEQNTTAVNSVTSNTTTITSVDTSRSYINFQGFTTSAGTQFNTVFHAEVLTNATTVTVSRATASTVNATGAWSVLQFGTGGGGGGFQSSWARNANTVLVGGRLAA